MDLKKLESYSIAYTEKKCNDFFASKKAITGEEIKRLSPVRQVNLLVFKNLFGKWKEETAKLRSPYFDYDNDEVQQSLKNLQNKLSNHIYITKEFFKPLLQEATLETFLNILHPKDFFLRLLFVNNSVTLHEVSDKQRFIEINREVIEGLRRHMELKHLSSLGRGDAEGVLDTIISDNHEQVSQNRTVVEIIAKELNVEVNEFLGTPDLSAELTKEKSEDTSSSVEEDFEARSQDSSEGNEKEEEQYFTESHAEEKSNEISLRDPGEKETDLKISGQAAAPLNQKFFSEHKTLNDLLRKEEGTFADKHSLQKISSIRAGITLNQKFFFVNNLFRGDQKEFDDLVTRMDQSESFDDARKILIDDYAARYNWNINKEEIQELLQVVERKFL